MTTRALLRSLLLLAALVTVPAAALDFPELTGRVVDETGQLSRDTIIQLSVKLERHERDTSNQVVVVVLKSLRGASIEEYGYQLGRAWGIGQATQNNGVLLIIAPNERKLRIEVGYGLEGTLTDAQSHLIIQNVITPRLREGRLDQAVIDGTDAILGTLGGTWQPPPPPAKKKATTNPREAALWVGLMVAFLGKSLLGASRLIASSVVALGVTAMVWSTEGALLIALGAGLVAFFIFLVLGGLFSAMGGGSFRGGGGGFSGGGFSGGGGSFGGGGASGGW